jgi:hypothetical protein
MKSKCEIQSWKRPSLLALLVLLICSPEFCFATPNVYGYIRYWDNREDRDTNSRVYPSNGMTTRVMKYGTLYVYDKDGSYIDAVVNENDDDLIEEVHITSSGYFYVDVGSSDPGGSGSQDVYFLFKFENPVGKVLNDLDNDIVVYSAIYYNLSSTVQLNWDVTCWTNSFNVNCVNDAAARSTASSPSHAIANAASNILQTMQDVDDYFMTIDPPMIAYYPNDPSSNCTSTIGYSISRDSFCIGTDLYDQNHRVAHEIGHGLEKRLLTPGPDCVSLTHGTCGGHSWNSIEDERCATAEGFADFVGAATHFAHNQTSAWYSDPAWTMEGATTFGNGLNALPCVSNSSASKHKMEGNVARFFWDLYDTTTLDDSGNDNENDPYCGTITAIWSEFTDQNADSDIEDDREADESSINGRNVFDYSYHASNAYSEDYSGERNQNCLNQQAP